MQSFDFFIKDIIHNRNLNKCYEELKQKINDNKISINMDSATIYINYKGKAKNKGKKKGYSSIFINYKKGHNPKKLFVVTITETSFSIPWNRIIKEEVLPDVIDRIKKYKGKTTYS